MLLMTKHELYIKLLIVRADAKPVKTSKSFRRDIRLELVRRPEDLRVAAHADLDEVLRATQRAIRHIFNHSGNMRK